MGGVSAALDLSTAAIKMQPAQGMEKNRENMPLYSELSSIVVVGDKHYTVVTKNMGGDNLCIVSTVYLGDETISTRKNYFGSVVKGRDIEKKIDEFMIGQHRATMNLFKAEKLKHEKSASYYLKKTKNLMGRGNNREALDLLIHAMEQYPHDPFLLSCYGCLTAMVEGSCEEGIETCRKAIEKVKQKIPYGLEFFYPSLYLNLGKAYLAAGRKEKAVDTFREGIEKSGRDDELVRELSVLGIRRNPAVPFLKRGNPINKYIGILLHKLNKYRF
jgi:hypothetical protein